MMKALLCWLTGHRPLRSRAVDYETHYPYPCWCGKFLTEHSDKDCDCSERWKKLGI